VIQVQARSQDIFFYRYAVFPEIIETLITIPRYQDETLFIQYQLSRRDGRMRAPPSKERNLKRHLQDPVPRHRLAYNNINPAALRSVGTVHAAANF
jgi:hypothetical protein